MISDLGFFMESFLHLFTLYSSVCEYVYMCCVCGWWCKKKTFYRKLTFQKKKTVRKSKDLLYQTKVALSILVN